MANPDHLAILELGRDLTPYASRGRVDDPLLAVRTWNEWRAANPDVIPDLSDSSPARVYKLGPHLPGVSFSQARLFAINLALSNLDGANFDAADLSRGNLHSSSLRRASLRGVRAYEAVFANTKLMDADFSRSQLQSADFSEADLGRSNLSNTSLTGAMVRGTNLEEVDLTNAYLARVDLTSARLTGAQVHNASLGWTRLLDVDLSEVEGLETVRHVGPSYIDITTIYRSRGRIPVAFLRGIGVPDTFITSSHSLVAPESLGPFYSCFISYSTQDQDFADHLHADLQNKGVRCWFAPHDMPTGARIRDTLHDAIRLHEKLLLILSENALASDWVADEVERVLDRERREKRLVLFPIRLDDTVMTSAKGWAATLRDRNIGDFTHWKHHAAYQTALARLLRDLQADQQTGATTP